MAMTAPEITRFIKEALPDAEVTISDLPETAIIIPPMLSPQLL